MHTRQPIPRTRILEHAFPFGAFIVPRAEKSHYGKYRAIGLVAHSRRAGKSHVAGSSVRSVGLVPRHIAGLSHGHVRHGVVPLHLAVDGRHAGLHIGGRGASHAGIQGGLAGGDRKSVV